MALTLLGLLALLAANAVVLSQNAFKTFRFFDMGSHLDAAWRIYSGQIPHVDFISYTGPIHFYLNAFFFKIFGFNKEALLAHLILANSILMLALWAVMRNRVPRVLSLLTAAAGMASFYWDYPHPWYTYTAHLFGIAGIAVLAAADIGNRRSGFKAAVALGILSALMLFTKANVFAAYTAVFLWILFWHSDRARTFAGFLAGAAAAILALRFTLVPSLGAFWDDVFVSFGSVVAGRVGSPFTHPQNWLLNYYWIVVAGVGIAAMAARYWNKSTHLFLLLWPIAVFCTSTSGAVYQCDTQLTGPLVALGFVTLFGILRTRPAGVARPVTHAAIVLLTAMSVFFLVLRTQYAYSLKAWSIPEVGKMIPVTQTIDPRGTYPMRSAPFKGWLVNPEQGMAVDEIAEYLQGIPKEDSVMVLTDLFIVYSLAGRDSYRGIPWVWTAGSNPAPGPQWERVRRRILDDPPDWIITHRGMVAYITGIIKYMDLQEWLPKSYVLTKDLGNYMVLRRK